jgi:hypothetical protein
VQDLIAKANVTSFWIEGGYASVDDRGWISISTTYTGFNNASVFVSLPNIPGQTSAEGYPAIARVQQVVPQGQVSFQTRLFQANDSFCSKQWRIPQYISTPLELSWLVVEHGAFLITDKYRVMVGRGAITRGQCRFKPKQFHPFYLSCWLCVFDRQLSLSRWIFSSDHLTTSNHGLQSFVDSSSASHCLILYALGASTSRFP